MALITGAMDDVALNAKITSLIYENTTQEISGTDMQETLVEIIKACAPKPIKCHGSITTADINKVVMFDINTQEAVLYQRTPANAGTNGSITIAFNALTPNLQGAEGVAYAKFVRQPIDGESIQSAVGTNRGTAMIRFVDSLAGAKAKYKISCINTVPIYPVGAKYILDFADGVNFENNNETVQIPSVSSTGFAGSNTYLAKDAPVSGNDFQIGVDLSESLDNLLIKLGAEPYLVGWTFTKESAHSIGVQNDTPLAAGYIAPTTYNGLEEHFDNPIGGLTRAAFTVTQTITGVVGYLLPKYIEWLDGIPQDGILLQLQIGDGTYFTELMIGDLLNDYSVLGIAPSTYYGWSVPTTLVEFSKIIGYAMNANVSSHFNVTGVNGYGDDEAWFEIEEKAIQTDDTMALIQFTFLDDISHDILTTHVGIDVLTEAAIPLENDDTNVYILIGADINETVATIAEEMTTYENLHGGHAIWEQVLAHPAWLKSRTVFEEDPTGWNISDMLGTLLDNNYNTYVGWNANHTGDLSLGLNNGQHSDPQHINFEWLDWDNMPASTSDEALLFRDMINSNTVGQLAGWTAAIGVGDGNAHKVILTTTAPRLNEHEISGVIDNWVNASFSNVVQGEPARPEMSNQLCLGVISGVLERDEQKYVVLTSSKVKKVLVKPHNPISFAYEGNVSNVLVGGNDGMAKSLVIDGTDTLAAYVGLAITPLADLDVPTLVDVIEIQPLFLLSGG